MSLGQAPLGQLPNINLPYSVPNYQRERNPILRQAGGAAASALIQRLIGNALARDYSQQYNQEGLGSAAVETPSFWGKLVSGPGVTQEQLAAGRRDAFQRSESEAERAQRADMFGRTEDRLQAVERRVAENEATRLGLTAQELAQRAESDQARIALGHEELAQKGAAFAHQRGLDWAKLDNETKQLVMAQVLNEARVANVKAETDFTNERTAGMREFRKRGAGAGQETTAPKSAKPGLVRRAADALADYPLVATAMGGPVGAYNSVALRGLRSLRGGNATEVTPEVLAAVQGSNSPIPTTSVAAVNVNGVPVGSQLPTAVMRLIQESGLVQPDPSGAALPNYELPAAPADPAALQPKLPTGAGLTEPTFRDKIMEQLRWIGRGGAFGPQ